MSRGAARSKGTFGEAGLPVSTRYLRPSRRSGLVWLGIGAGLIVLLLTGFDFFVGDGVTLAGGPLSSNHANLDRDCAACHTELAGVEDKKCAVCHEKLGDRLGVYTFAAHYLYRSNDFQRLTPSPDEVPCATCHREHEGRHAQIIATGDGVCLRCHEYGSFNREHPEFAAVAVGTEDPGLVFPHIHHVREVLKREALVDVEKACLYCHNAGPAGRSFEPIDFDRHCDGCHLTTTTATPLVPIQQAGTIGVQTLTSFQESGELGTRWAFYTNPNEFRATRSEVRKSPVYHRDPWILENLRRLRQLRFPDAGLADLLRASSDVQPHELNALYDEAIETLRGFALELRSRPERDIQRQLRVIEERIANLEARLRDPYTPLDETKFLLSLAGAGELGEAEVAQVDGVVEALTEPCRECHLVEDATLVRVQKSQHTLRRAEFDHRAHILQRRCLDCHVEIPFAEHVDGVEAVAAEADRAEIQNLPGIRSCRQCHDPERVSNRCVTCHYFHPNKSQRSELLLYFD